MIPTPDRRLRVFISSTLGELAAERAAVRGAVEGLRLTPVMFELGARTHGAEDVYRDYLAQSDVFVAVYWQSYGWVAPGRDISGLEHELRLAEGMPRLIYVKEPAPEREERLQAMIGELWTSNVATKNISGPDDLAEQLTQDLALLLSERFSAPVRRLPTGTVTFLFADIEGSTALLERYPEAFAETLVAFRRASEKVVGEHRGTVVRIEGDGFLAVFKDARDAVAGAVAAQQAYAALPSATPFSVRMGLHSGSGVVVDDDYVGIDVHRAARVGAAARGGQVLVSATTRELVTAGELEAFEDLGWYEMKGLSRSEHLFQVRAPGLPEVTLRPTAPGALVAPLPTQLSPIVGREREIEAVVSILAEARLLTLTGPGGVGKTRLAVAAAERVAEQFRDGVGFVDLAPVQDADRVPAAIASALGRNIEGSVAAEEVLADELRDRHFLLVLDSFEHVAGTAPLLRRILERCPRLTLLVTSRTALRIGPEREYQVGPLPTPEGDDAEAVARSASTKLLVERARAVRPDFRIDEESAADIAELVRRVDGLPLAIELIATRLRLLSPREVLARLDSALELGGGRTDLPERQRTLRAAIDSSFQQLDPSERTVFRRLGVFVGGWSLEAAEGVVTDDDIPDVTAQLDALATQSLIRVEPGRRTRMKMLGPLREYARESLASSGDLDSSLARHAFYYRTATESYPRKTGALDEWLDEVEADWGNIRQALEWCVAHEDFTGLAGMLRDLWPAVWVGGRLEEGRRWVEILRSHMEELEPPLRAWNCYVGGFFALEMGHYAETLEWGRQGLALATELGEREAEGNHHLLLAGALPALDPDDPAILEHIEAAIAIFEEQEEVVSQAYAHTFMTSYLASRGEMEEAKQANARGLRIAETVTGLPIHAQLLVIKAFLALLEGEGGEARVALDQAQKLLEERPNHEILSYLLDAHGLLAIQEGRIIPGMSALGASEGIRERLQFRIWPLMAAQNALLTQLADSIQDPEAQAARASGRRLTPGAALHLVAPPQPAPG